MDNHSSKVYIKLNNGDKDTGSIILPQDWDEMKVPQHIKSKRFRKGITINNNLKNKKFIIL